MYASIGTTERSPFNPMVIVAGAAGGAVGGLGQVKLIVFNFLVNVFTLASFSPIVWFLAEALVSFACALALVLVFGYEGRPASGQDAGVSKVGED